MLLVLVALVHLANAVLGLAPDLAGAPVTLQRMLGVAMAPLAWLAGVPWAEAQVAGALLGTKTVLNELLAYIDLGQLPESELAPRSRLIMTYALCGFANFGSLGIMIGGLATMAPERRSEIVALGAQNARFRHPRDADRGGDRGRPVLIGVCVNAIELVAAHLADSASGTRNARQACRIALRQLRLLGEPAAALADWAQAVDGRRAA